MSNIKLKLGLVAVAAFVLACSAFAAPSWINHPTTNTYTWTSWGSEALATEGVCDPDVLIGTGWAEAAFMCYGAGLVADPMLAIGSRYVYLDLGPDGVIHVDFSTHTFGNEVFVQVVFHEDMCAAPVVSLNAGEMLIESTTPLEDTSLCPELPSSWVAYESVWSISGNDIASFAGVDIIGDSDWGSMVESVSISTRAIPEPATVAAMLSGIVGLALGLRRRKVS